MLDYAWSWVKWAFSDNLNSAITTFILSIVIFPLRERINRRYGASLSLRYKKSLVRRLRRLTHHIHMVRDGSIHLEVIRYCAIALVFVGLVNFVAVASLAGAFSHYQFGTSLALSVPVAVSVYSFNRALSIASIGTFPQSEILQLINLLDRKRQDQLTDKERKIVLQYLVELSDCVRYDDTKIKSYDDLSDIEKYFNVAHSVTAEAEFVRSVKEKRALRPGGES